MKYVMILTVLMTTTFAADGFAEKPQVEIIKAKRLQEVEKLPAFYQGALTPELEKELRTNEELYRELNQRPDLTKALYSRRDLQRALVREQITIEQIQERVEPNIKARKKEVKQLEELRREQENSPVGRIQNSGNIRREAPRRIGGGTVPNDRPPNQIQ